MTVAKANQKDSLSRFQQLVQRFYIWIFAALLLICLSFILSLNAFTNERIEFQANDRATEEDCGPRGR